ncbi:MAG: hypothetical protein ABSA48_04035 [Terracidiphilus sp.]
MADPAVAMLCHRHPAALVLRREQSRRMQGRIDAIADLQNIRID